MEKKKLTIKQSQEVYEDYIVSESKELFEKFLKLKTINEAETLIRNIPENLSNATLFRVSLYFIKNRRSILKD